MTLKSFGKNDSHLQGLHRKYRISLPQSRQRSRNASALWSPYWSATATESFVLILANISTTCWCTETLTVCKRFFFVWMKNLPNENIKSWIHLPSRIQLSYMFLKNQNVPGEIRTPDRRLRRPLLYPAELLGHKWREYPDLNRGWRFCRPVPYHLAILP